MTFDEQCVDFWENHLHKGMKSQGKPKTFEALAKALKMATYEKICEGIPPYVMHKPDWKAFCMASVYLNQQRWTAEYEDANPFSERLTATQALERNGNVIAMKGKS